MHNAAAFPLLMTFNGKTTVLQSHQYYWISMFDNASKHDVALSTVKIKCWSVFEFTKTPHSSPSWVSYGVSFVSSNSDHYSIFFVLSEQDDLEPCWVHCVMLRSLYPPIFSVYIHSQHDYLGTLPNPCIPCRLPGHFAKPMYSMSYICHKPKLPLSPQTYLLLTY